jgi:hypothetical protein
MSDAMRWLSRNLRSAAFGFLGLIAVSAALAQSLCEAHQPTPLHEHDCCVFLVDDALAAPPAATAPAVTPPAVAPAASALLAGWRPTPTRFVGPLPDRPPPSRRYHARSSRILT